jgi:hypothetical protein
MIHVDRFFGPFYFGQDIASLQSDGMRQVTEQELEAMRAVGMHFNPEEKVFTGNFVYYNSIPDWRPIVVVRDGKVFNINTLLASIGELSYSLQIHSPLFIILTYGGWKEKYEYGFDTSANSSSCW